MKVQRIETKKGYRYLLLDNDFNVIVPVRSYLKYLDNIDRAANTIKNYAHHLKIYFEYLDAINVEYDEIAINGNNPIELLEEFASWLEDPTSIHKNVSLITSTKSVRKNKNIKDILHEKNTSKNLSNKKVLSKRYINQCNEYSTRYKYDAINQQCYTFKDKAIISIQYEDELRYVKVLGLYIEYKEVFNHKIKI